MSYKELFRSLSILDLIVIFCSENWIDDNVSLPQKYMRK